MSFTSVNRDDLQKAFGLAHKASEDPTLTREMRLKFRAIAVLIWKAHGEQTPIPPRGAGAEIIAALGDK